jgi:hypothetical protein
MENLKIKDLRYKGEEEHPFAIVATATAANKTYKIIYDHAGNPLTDKDLVELLNKFYELEFEPALLDDDKCFIHIENGL